MDIHTAGRWNLCFTDRINNSFSLICSFIFAQVFSKSYMTGKELSMSNLFHSEYEEETGCCSCLEFLKPSKPIRSTNGFPNHLSEELTMDDYGCDIFFGRTSGLVQHYKDFGVTFGFPEQNGVPCKGTHVKETYHVSLDEDANGKKMINEYVRECKIASGSYGKVSLYRSNKDEKQYAIKAFYKSRLARVPVAPSETAMTDVFREVSVMKMLDHPNIVNLIEVIDDPDSDRFYMVLEYVEGKQICVGSGPDGGIGENTARRYFRDIVAGLMYLHSHNIVHGDIKPENLLVTSIGRVKIGDFGVSHAFANDNDELRRTPGTPVFTAPECIDGLTYHGKAADIWALGITLYYMVLGHCPFIGDCLQDTYVQIVDRPLSLPEEMNPNLKDLLEGLLQKDPKQRTPLDRVAEHPWVVCDDGPIPQSSCRCKHDSFQRGNSGGDKMDSGSSTKLD